MYQSLSQVLFPLYLIWSFAEGRSREFIFTENQWFLSDVVRGFSRGLLLFRTAFEGVSPKETRPVEPLLQIVICVHQGERTRTKTVDNESEY